MTPSDAHDYAYRRDAGHDGMAIDVMRAWRGFLPDLTWTTSTYDKDSVTGLFLDIYAEDYRSIGKSYYFFLDLTVLYKHTIPKIMKDNRTVSHEDIKYFEMGLELKPKIETVGGIIRQLKVQQDKLEKSRSDRSDICTAMHPVFMADDPKLEMFAEMYRLPFYVLDRKTKELSMSVWS